MNHIILYTIGCPKCIILKNKLDNKNIDYDVIYNEEEIEKAGITLLPVLEINGEKLDYGSAIKWVNAQ